MVGGYNVTIDPGLRRLALRTLLAAFPGSTAPDWATALVADGLAGHVLFGFNVSDRAQLTALTAQLRAARADVLVGIDEEGGDVTRLAHREGSPYPGNAALGMVDQPDLTRRVYRAIGAELDEAGITSTSHPPSTSTRPTTTPSPVPAFSAGTRPGSPGTPPRPSPGSSRPVSPPAPNTSRGTARRSSTPTLNCPLWTLRSRYCAPATCRRSSPPSRRVPGRS